MIQTSDVILKMRSRLNDRISSNQKWKDEEYIDCINSAILRIYCEIFNNTTYSYKIKTLEGKHKYKLPDSFLNDVTVTLDGNLLNKKSLTWHFQNEFTKESSYYFLDHNSLNIYPGFEIVDGLDIEIQYSNISLIETSEDVIELNILLQECILFYSLFIAFAMPPFRDNKNKDEMLFLYKENLNVVKPVLSSRNNSRKIRSKYKKV